MVVKTGKLKPNIVALSLGITSVVLYVICLVLVAITPAGALVPFMNSLIHSVDFSSMMTKSITLTGSVVGIIAWFVIAAITGYIFAFVYNWVLEKV